MGLEKMQLDLMNACNNLLREAAMVLDRFIMPHRIQGIPNMPHHQSQSE
jgi:hypothetical protein